MKNRFFSMIVSVFLLSATAYAQIQNIPTIVGQTAPPSMPCNANTYGAVYNLQQVGVFYTCHFIGGTYQWGLSSIGGGALGSIPYQFALNQTVFLASPTTSGHKFTLMWQPSGSAIAPTAVDVSTLGTYGAAGVICSTTAPTITSGWGTGATVLSTNNGTCGFTIQAGSAAWSTSMVLGMPTAGNRWGCMGTDISNPTTIGIRMIASGTSSVTMQPYTISTGAAVVLPGSDYIILNCQGQ